MKTIALTGDPTAQQAAHLQLTVLLQDRGMDGEVRIGFVGDGLTARAEAYVVHDEGGEIWQCGPTAPRPSLVGLIDRVLPATTFDAMGLDIVTSLAEFVAKTRVAL